MASEYLLKKYKDVKPDEVRELTKEEKRRNWWYYHKWHVVIGAVLVLVLADILGHALGIGQVKPDYAIAYVGSHTLGQETAAALRSGLEALSTDMNGDGKVVVELSQYVTPDTSDSDALYYAEAAIVQMIGDLTDCKSYFFLLEDPQDFQSKTSSLRNLDGSLPADDNTEAEGKYLLWGSCPALAGIDLGSAQDAVNAMGFARRGFWGEKVSANAEACDALWDALTK